ncbi:MAG: class II aldolase/adducin family protein [Firmicutes bacterium]|nr:class II aldolase/adducin family protein [Bacillota bacterium]
MLLEDLRSEALATAVELERLGLASVGPVKGSLSARDAGSGNVVMSPSGMRYGNLAPADFVVIDSAAGVLEGARKPSLDLVFHLAIYAARPDVSAVIHTHSPYASAFACLNREIPVIMLSQANTIGGAIKVAPFEFPDTRDLGESIARTIGRLNGVLLENHGVVAVGKSLGECLTNACIIENCAEIYAISSSLGSPRVLDNDLIDRARRFYASRYGQRG